MANGKDRKDVCRPHYVQVREARIACNSEKNVQLKKHLLYYLSLFYEFFPPVITQMCCKIEKKHENYRMAPNN